MSVTSQRDLIASLREVVAATTRADCVDRIKRHLERLFRELGPTLVLDPRPIDDEATGQPRAPGREPRFPLRARGRRLGHIAISNPEELDDSSREQLSAFADHAAVALDNARMLEDHARRARRDPLTGLLNRGEFQDMLAATVAGTERDPALTLSLAVFDLDHFKTVNELGGHSAGDRLLRATAAALIAVSRSTDVVFRIGGDEFAVLLPDCAAEDAATIASRAADAISGLDGSVGASWGVATIPTDATTREALLAVADATMYERKGGKGKPRESNTGSSNGDNRDSTSSSRVDTRSRLEVASGMASRLSLLNDPLAIAQTVVDELHSAFWYYLVVIHRLDADQMLRSVAAAGHLTQEGLDWLAQEQPITVGINGRVARTGELSLVDDTRRNGEYLASSPSLDPGSELSVPIHVRGEVWGVLNLEQLATHGFDEQDVVLAEAVVGQIGAALHRCLLVDEVESSFSAAMGVLCDTLLSRRRS